jgi:hypothetical protein
MSARGARSRKVAQKEVEKKEKNPVVKGKAPEPIRENHDAFTEWRPSPNSSNARSGIQRSLTVSIAMRRRGAVLRTMVVTTIDHD